MIRAIKEKKSVKQIIADLLFFLIFALVCIGLMCLFCSATGCMFSSPLYKEVERLPLPKESAESKEQTRIALEAIGKLVIQDMDQDALMLVNALQVKYGDPVKPIECDPGEVATLYTEIMKSVREYREKVAEWYRNYDKTKKFSQEEKSFGKKLKERFWFWLIVVIIFAIACPTGFIAAVRFLKSRWKTLKEGMAFEKRKANQTVKAINKFRRDDPDGFEKLEPHLKKAQDKDIQDNIKEGI